jgi:uncharacterized protein DUF5681
MAFRKGHSGNPSRQFRKGQSGNPGGRPKTKLFSEAMIRLAQLPLAEYKKFRPKNQAEKIAKRWLDDAGKGVSTALREALDRTEGKVPLPITGDNGPMEMKVEIVHIGARSRTNPSRPDRTAAPAG